MSTKTTTKLHNRINGKGWREQEQALLFPTLYSAGHKLTRNFAGYMVNFDRNLRLGKFEP